MVPPDPLGSVRGWVKATCLGSGLLAVILFPWGPPSGSPQTAGSMEPQSPLSSSHPGPGLSVPCLYTWATDHPPFPASTASHKPGNSRSEGVPHAGAECPGS